LEKKKNEIGIVISTVSEAVKVEFGKFDAFYTNSKNAHDQGVTLLKNFIGKLEGDILASHTACNKATAENIRLKKERDQHGADIHKAQADLKALQDMAHKEVKEFKEFGAEAEHKLVIIKALRDIITDELLGEQKGRHSFVQLQTFNDKLHELKTLLENSNDVMYAPLVATLLSLSEGRGFSDQKILGQILTALNNLEKNLLAFRKKQDDSLKKNLLTLKASMGEKLNQIKTLAKMIAQANSNIQDNDTICATANRDVKSINNERDRKAKELAYWMSLGNYQAEIARYAKVGHDAFNAKLKSATTALLG